MNIINPHFSESREIVYSPILKNASTGVSHREREIIHNRLGRGRHLVLMNLQDATHNRVEGAMIWIPAWRKHRQLIRSTGGNGSRIKHARPRLPASIMSHGMRTGCGIGPENRVSHNYGSQIWRIIRRQPVNKDMKPGRAGPPYRDNRHQYQYAVYYISATQ